jgi:hypothetical protein
MAGGVIVRWRRAADRKGSTELRKRHRAVAHRDDDLLEQALKASALWFLRRTHAQRAAAGGRAARPSASRRRGRRSTVTGSPTETSSGVATTSKPNCPTAPVKSAAVPVRRTVSVTGSDCVWIGRDSSKKPLKVPRRCLTWDRLMAIVAGPTVMPGGVASAASRSRRCS